MPNKAASKLIAVTDLDKPGVIFRTAVAKGEQFFEHDRYFHTIRRTQRMELKRMATDRQVFVMRRSRDWSVDICKAAAALYYSRLAAYNRWKNPL